MSIHRRVLSHPLALARAAALCPGPIGLIAACLVAIALVAFGRPCAAENDPLPAGFVEATCELVWEVPGETDAYLLGGLLVDAGWDQDGNLCVVDYRNKDLKVFSRDGDFLRTLGRAGEGPGESRDARRLLLAADGRRGLLQVFPATVVWLHADGSPAGRTAIQNTLSDQGGFVAVTHAVQNGREIMAYATVMAMIGGSINEQHWIAPLLPDGGLGRPLYTRTVEQPARDQRNRVDEGEYYDVWAARWAPDGHGGVWLAPERDRYLLLRHDRDGAPSQTVTRPYTPLRRDDLGRRLATEHMGRKRLAADEVKLRDQAPVVRSLRLSDAGYLWVDLDLGGRGPEPGTIAWIDVIDADGDGDGDGDDVWRPQIRLRGPVDPDIDQWRWVDDRHLLVLRAGGEDLVSLRLLRWREPGP
jgi:hypothetical protein